MWVFDKRLYKKEVTKVNSFKGIKGLTEEQKAFAKQLNGKEVKFRCGYDDFGQCEGHSIYRNWCKEK